MTELVMRRAGDLWRALRGFDRVWLLILAIPVALLALDPANAGKLTATGYSCRSQTKRMDQISLPHPLQVLLAQQHK